MKQEIDNNAMWAAFRQELSLQGELQVVAAIDNALNNLGFTIEETSTIIPIPLKQGEHADFLNKIQIGDRVTRNEDGVLVNLSQLNRVAKKDVKQGEKVKPIEGFNTEFERQVSCLIASAMNRDYEYTKDFVKWTSEGLLNYAKLEIEKNSMGISEAAKKKLEDNLNKALEKETPESWNKFLEKQDEYKPNPCDECININGCINCENGELKETEQKPAWSEEDEDILNTIINHFKVDVECTDEDDMVRWLKSLRPQWKPNEEMLEALYRAIPKNVMEISEDEMLLDKLYQGLKYGRVLSEK